MPATVKLVVIRGKLLGAEFVFNSRTSCIVGRSEDCDPCLPNDDHHSTISRHHCLLDVNPPDIRVRDFGSLNGTSVNGKKIGQRAEGQSREQAARAAFPEHDLQNGDRLELGDTVFRVVATLPAACVGCGVEIGAALAAAGATRCPQCPNPGETTPLMAVPRPRRTCSRCGTDVAGEGGVSRPGEFVCGACRADPERIARELMTKTWEAQNAPAGVRDYRIVRELGRGGMGAVYLAEHSATGATVALKIMLPQVAVDASSRELFLREVESTKALDHPNVVRLYDSGCSDGVFYFTLEYCAGGSLDQLVKQRGPLAPTEAVPFVLQALDGLDYAHHATGPDAGLVHRDLKPGNLLLSGDGANRVVKVADYGLAKSFDLAGLSGQTRTGEKAGTPSFMPRQQVINFKYAKPEVDVWAAAASLYYLLTGQPPRDFSGGRDWWQVVLQTDAVPIRQRQSTVPKRLAEVVDQALIDRPTIGFRTAAEFKRALTDAS